MNYYRARSLARELRKHQTTAEKIFWQKVRNKPFLGLKFTRQFLVEYILVSEKRYFIADFYCHAYKLIIEIDGEIHNFQRAADQNRSEIIRSRGYNMLRFSNELAIENWSELQIRLQ